MSESSNGYHISFFKPTTPQALANRNLTIWLVLIWAVAIFGFHFLMRAIEKPTPEPAYVAFQEAWTNIEAGTAGTTDYQEFGQSMLSVLGKAVSPDHRKGLGEAMSWSVYMLTEDSLKADLINKIKDFEALKGNVDNIADKDYIAAKQALSGELSPVLNLSFMDIRSQLLPIELTSANIEGLSDLVKTHLPGIMAKYLIHNQSVLTDTIFLGFPFHYFYTAVFLLILFVGLCWLYCVRIDKINAKFNIID